MTEKMKKPTPADLSLLAFLLLGEGARTVELARSWAPFPGEPTNWHASSFYVELVVREALPDGSEKYVAKAGAPNRRLGNDQLHRMGVKVYARYADATVRRLFAAGFLAPEFVEGDGGLLRSNSGVTVIPDKRRVVFRITPTGIAAAGGANAAEVAKTLQDRYRRERAVWVSDQVRDLTEGQRLTAQVADRRFEAALGQWRTINRLFENAHYSGESAEVVIAALDVAAVTVQANNAIIEYVDAAIGKLQCDAALKREAADVRVRKLAEYDMEHGGVPS